MEFIEKNPSGHLGNRTFVSGLSQQTCHALDHHASPKKRTGDAGSRLAIDSGSRPHVSRYGSPHTFVPRHICALKCYNRVVTIMSGHKCVWTQMCTFVPRHIL